MRERIGAEIGGRNGCGGEEGGDGNRLVDSEGSYG